MQRTFIIQGIWVTVYQSVDRYLIKARWLNDENVMCYQKYFVFQDFHSIQDAERYAIELFAQTKQI